MRERDDGEIEEEKEGQWQDSHRDGGKGTAVLSCE